MKSLLHHIPIARGKGNSKTAVKTSWKWNNYAFYLARKENSCTAAIAYCGGRYAEHDGVIP